MGKLYTEKQGLACALEGMLWNDGNKDEFCIHPSDGPQVCCGNNGIPVKRDTTFTLDTTAPVVSSTQSDVVDHSHLTKRSGYIVSLNTYVDQACWYRQKFSVSGLTCSDLENEFNKEISTLPNEGHRNLECDIADGAFMGEFKIRLTIVTHSTYNTDDGKKQMACAIQEVLSASGNGDDFCSISGICCWNWKTS
ncbi:hypothetical protein LTR10_007485 [Elasticomyces elasticus]|nr:hypothetical protein LTR10_007485 [Elasticomyces elasticus]KAK4979292.1 hypothetical protein LTR42_001795 [Elasticomyces elasticus]